MSVKTLTIDGNIITSQENQTILQAARANGIPIPSLCQLEGVSNIGACRLCLVEIEKTNRLLPACVTQVAEDMVVRTHSQRLDEYRRMILELIFAERNHICSVCVANGHCELQSLAARIGMDHVRFEYQFPKLGLDVSHHLFGIDHNRCILCTRCVRVCDEIEGAHTWDVADRGKNCQVITDMRQPWGKAESCTSCGKCVQACPTGALFRKGSTVAEMEKDRSMLAFLVHARENNQWVF